MSSTHNNEKEHVLTGSFVDFTHDMEQLMYDTATSDVKLQVGPDNDVFHAHKCVLTSRCPKFKEMFEGTTTTINTAMTSSTAMTSFFALHDADSACFRIMLQFIYTNSCHVTRDNVIDVLLIATEYKLSQLVRMCEKFILETITIETGCAAMQAAVTFGLDGLKRALLPFFEENTKEIFNLSQFNELSGDTLAYLLQSDELDMDEYDIIACVRRWACVNSVAMDTPMFAIAGPVVCNLRLPLLSSEDLQKVEKENTSSHLIPVEQISMAWRHIALNTPSSNSLETTPRKGTRKKK